MRSWHALPLVAHGQATGVLTLATTGDRAFSDRDLDLAREFASRAALALTNAYDYERERQARASAERASERLGHLHRITAALAQAVTTDEVARAIAVEGGAAFGADAAATQLLTEDGSALELATATGHLSELLGRYGRLSTDQEVPAVAGDPLGEGALVRVGRRAGRALSRPRAGARRARGGRLRAADRPRAAARPPDRELRPAARS